MYKLINCNPVGLTPLVRFVLDLYEWFLHGYAAVGKNSTDRADFSSFAAFKQTIEQIDFSQFLFGYDN